MRNDYLTDTRAPTQTHYMKRHASMIVGVVLSVLVHAFAIWMAIEHNPPISLEKIQGNSNTLSITLLSRQSATRPQGEQPPDDIRKKEPVKKNVQAKKSVQEKKKTPKPLAIPVPQPQPAPPVIVHAGPREMRPPPADDMSSMLEAARRRRAQAQSRDDAPSPDDETQRRNKVVLANVANSIGQAMGTDQNGHGGVFQIRHVGALSAEFLFRGWNTDLHRNSTQLVEVFKKSDPDIQTAVIKKMIEIIRQNKHDEFVWESYRLGKEVTLSALPENQAHLENFLMQEFFPDYVPRRQ